MIPLTVHLMIHNDQSRINQTLNSLPENVTVLIGDAGSRDDTVSICEQRGYKVKRISINNNRGRVRNEMTAWSSTEWQMFLEPGEAIISGVETLPAILEAPPRSYCCEVMTEDTITKQIRLWRKGAVSFVNPVYERINDDQPAFSEIVLWNDSVLDPNKEKLLVNWKKTDPLAVEPYYFEACNCLRDKRYKDFLSLADHYLFHQKKPTVAATMTRYYQGLVNCLVTNDLETAVRCAVSCLTDNLLMAEFWCLLGDVYYQTREYEKSIAFYENAITLGKNRLRADKWPVHISKYGDYPNDMLRNCREIMDKSQQFASVKIPHQAR